jgi:NAD(P)-dependent dehydrogenase (short-subunit alcohol dehydrogenase family)
MFRRLIDINLTGTFVCAQAVGNAMIKSSTGGSMVFLASMSGHIVNWPQQQASYNASKAGVIMLAKSLAAEWAQFHIRVNSVSPGYMDTALNRVPALDAQKKLWKERTPMARLGEIDELNQLAVFLASDASTYMTGSDVIIDVSHPHAVTRYLCKHTNSATGRLHRLVNGSICWDET